MSKASEFIIRLYFAVVAAVALFTLMFGAIDLLDIALKTYVFPTADGPSYIIKCDSSVALDTERPVEAPVYDCEGERARQLDDYQREKASNTVRNLSLILISLPIFLLHFRIVLKDWKNAREKKRK